jgi:predicted metal-dependent hydrolase
VTWLKHYSVRKLAHYAFRDDEIAFSLIFDFPDTPAEILSYLAYHELLHRQLGAQRINGRRYAHTRDFKTRESLFPNWRRMDETIALYIRTAG